MMTRRRFVAVSAGAALAGPAAVAQQGVLRLGADEVEECVRVAHFDLDKVKELVAARPALARAAWDWGGGDFETCLGAAAHMGRRDIAGFLLESGASFDLFASAMLGELSAVQAVIAARPGLLHSKGAHGLSLVYHAERGGADETAAWLKEQGAE